MPTQPGTISQGYKKNGIWYLSIYIYNWKGGTMEVGCYAYLKNGLKFGTSIDNDLTNLHWIVMIFSSKHCVLKGVFATLRLDNTRMHSPKQFRIPQVYLQCNISILLSSFLQKELREKMNNHVRMNYPKKIRKITDAFQWALRELIARSHSFLRVEHIYFLHIPRSTDYSCEVKYKE